MPRSGPTLSFASKDTATKTERNRPHNHKRDTQRLACEKLRNEAL